MNSLVTYINAIRRQPGAVEITDQLTRTSRYQDDESEIVEEETTYRFANGVVIRHTIEQDSAPSDLICEECWISYEVLDAAELQISPPRKLFHNRCQQDFWLKMQAVRSAL